MSFESGMIVEERQAYIPIKRTDNKGGEVENPAAADETKKVKVYYSCGLILAFKYARAVSRARRITSSISR